MVPPPSHPDAPLSPAHGRLAPGRWPHAWFVACDTRDLATRPVARLVAGVPLVLWRAGGRAVAALDRCPHRNVPLSRGRVLPGGRLQCVYHGWEFDEEGRCRAVPGLEGAAGEQRARDATTLATREQDGFVWVHVAPGAPRGEPWRPPHLDDRRYGLLRRTLTVQASLEATAENALDVPHTAFLHAGLFRRAGSGTAVEVVVRRHADRVEAEYVGEPRPPGLAPRLLAPGRGPVRHVDRFLLPSIVQVEYRLGERAHLVSSAALTPVDEATTRLHAVIALRTPLPRLLVRLVAAPVMETIFRQDARILAAQTATLRAFGGERFAHSPLDVVGAQIRRLLRRAAVEDAPQPDDDAREFRLRLRL